MEQKWQKKRRSALRLLRVNCLVLAFFRLLHLQIVLH